MRRLAAQVVAAVAVASGWTRLARARRHARGDFRVAILAYHGVTHGAEREGVVSAARLVRQLRGLKRHYRVVSLTAAAAQLAQGNLREDLLVLTFDDGYQDNYRVAWPVLAAEGASATIFLTTGFLDGKGLWFDFAHRALVALARRPAAVSALVQEQCAALLPGWQPHTPSTELVRQLKYLHPRARQIWLDCVQALDLELAPPAQPLTWDEVRALLAAGAGIGAHTVSHPILATLSREEQEREIQGCRERIAAETGTAPTTFAFPNGSPRDFNQDTLEALKKNRFRTSCSMLRGTNSPGGEPLTLLRIGVGHDPNFLLEARLAGLFDQALRQRLRL